MLISFNLDSEMTLLQLQKLSKTVRIIYLLIFTMSPAEIILLTIELSATSNGVRETIFIPPSIYLKVK